MAGGCIDTNNDPVDRWCILAHGFAGRHRKPAIHLVKMGLWSSTEGEAGCSIAMAADGHCSEHRLSLRSEKLAQW